MALQIRKVKEIPASSQHLNGSNVNLINNNHTAPKHATKEDAKYHLLLRRSGRIDQGDERKNNFNNTTSTATTPASTVSRTRLYLERSALKEYKAEEKANALHLPTPDRLCQGDNDEDDIWHTSSTTDGDCSHDSVNLDLDIASYKSRIEKSNSVKCGKRSFSSTRVAKSNEKNIKRKTDLDPPQQVTYANKIDKCDSKKEIKPSTSASPYDSGKSDRHMSLRLRKR